MLWCTQFSRTLLSTTGLRMEVQLQAKCDSFLTTRRNLHHQSFHSSKLSSEKIYNVIIIKKRYASLEPNGINCIPKTIIKFSTENINKLAGLPTIEVLLKSIDFEEFMPVESFQNCLLYLHTHCGLPWWSTIVISVLTVRLSLFPFVVLTERNNACNINNSLHMQFLKKQLDKAKKSMDDVQTTRFTQEICLFEKLKKPSLHYSFIVNLVQAPLFVCFLISLRGMTNAPFQSMREGGLLWFNDLISADSICMLPILTSVTLCKIFELTLRNSKLIMENKTAFNILRASPFAMLPCTVNLPAACLFYWICNNFITLAQASLLRNSGVRYFFEIPSTINHSPKALLLKKEAETEFNARISKEFEVRERLTKKRYSKFRNDAIKQQTENMSPIPK